MGVSVSDISITGVWQDLNTESGLAKTKSLMIQNKSSDIVVFYISDTSPDETDSDGFYLLPNAFYTFESNLDGVFFKGVWGKIAVQDMS